MTKATTEADPRIGVIMAALDDFHVLAGRVTQTHAAHVLQRLEALSPPKGGAEPFTYAYRYPVANGQTAIRFDTGGREINGSRPIEAIPLYALAQPGSDEREAREIADRLEDLLSGNDEMHPVGCSEWDERARVAIDMAKSFILATTPAIREGGEGK